MPPVTDSADSAKARRAYRALMRAGVLEMALGVFWLVFPFAGHGIFRIVGGIAIICGGLVILGYALAIRRKVRGR
jgi:uncharacterized membrane protein HdeD (DUF308 family)